MNQPAKAQEPSMEEILASIRRIIADDDTAKPATGRPAVAAPSVAAAPEVKPAPVAVAPVPAAAPAAAPAKAPDATNSQDDIDALFASFDAAPEPEEPPPAPPPPEPVAVAAPPPPPSAPPPSAAKPPRDEVLELTEEMRTAAPGLRKVDGHPDVVFSEHSSWTAAPAAARPVEDDRPLMSKATTAAVDSAFNTLAHTVLVQNARTLEDLVREMLRPLLKAWLDDNLPQMVERLVRAEIERVSRGQR